VSQRPTSVGLDPFPVDPADESWASLFSRNQRPRISGLRAFAPLRNPVGVPHSSTSTYMKCQHCQRGGVSISVPYCEIFQGEEQAANCRGLIFGVADYCPECGRETDRVKRLPRWTNAHEYTEGVDSRSAFEHLGRGEITMTLRSGSSQLPPPPG